MMRSNNNGAWLALGLVGLAAGAAAISTRRMGTLRGGSFARLPHGSKCSCCGTKVGSLVRIEGSVNQVEATVYKTRARKDDGLRYIMSGSGYEVYVKAGPAALTPAYKTSRAPAGELVPTLPSGKAKAWQIKPAHASSLLRSRFDARNAFLVPFEDTRSLKGEYTLFENAKRVSFSKLTPEEQDEELDKLGNRLFTEFGIGAYDENGDLSEPIRAREYALQKAVLRTKKEAGGASEGSEAYKRAFEKNEQEYLLTIYVDRLWTIRLLERYHAQTPSKRRAVFGRGKGENIFDNIDLQMKLPGPVSADVFSAPDALTRAQSRAQSQSGIDENEERAQEAQADRLDELADAEKDVKGGPQIRMYKDGIRQTIFFVGTAGTQYFPYGLSRIVMLTATSKMSSPSFGLPAGATEEGGTCPARLFASPIKLDAEDKPGRREVICDRCYAMGANYGYANNMIAQQGRARWVRQFTDERKGTFAESREERVRKLGSSLALMVASYAIYGAGGGRSDQEIGVWNKSEGIIESGVMGRRRDKVKDTDLSIVLDDAVLRPTQVAALRNRSAVSIKNTREWFKLLGVEDGKVCGFFRLHDSGDFGVSGSASAYIEAWSRVFSMLPHVQFWAPTRMWANMVTRSRLEANPEWVKFDKRFMGEFIPGRTQQKLVKTYRLRKQQGSRGVVSSVKKQQPELASTAVSPGESGLQLADLDKLLDRHIVPNEVRIREFQQISKNTPNIALRPSNLYVTGFEPLAPGASEQQLVSSGLSANIPYFEGFSAGTGVVKAYKKGVYPKVYDMRGIQAYACPVYTKDEEGKEAKSCRDAKCRACWLAQNLPVFYGAH